MSITGQGITIVPEITVTRKNEQIYNANINYTNYSGASSGDKFSLGTYYADAITVILEACLDTQYGKFYTRYCLTKGKSQYGYIVDIRWNNDAHEVVCLILSRSASGEIFAQPFKCNASGTKQTKIKIIGIADVDLFDEWGS